MGEGLRLSGIDHVVFVVADAERSLAWYVDVLGCAPERVEQWRAGDVPFPSVRISETAVIDLLEGTRDGTNVDHVALTVDSDTDLDAVAGAIAGADGPHPRWGAFGHGTSWYLRDPDDNVVELKTYR